MSDKKENAKTDNSIINITADPSKFKRTAYIERTDTISRDSEALYRHNDWQKYYEICRSTRRCGDDLFFEALKRAEESFSGCAEDYPEERNHYMRLAALIHGIRCAGNFEDAMESLQAAEIKLTDFEDGLLTAFCTLDVNHNVKIFA